MWSLRKTLLYFSNCYNLAFGNVLWAFLPVIIWSSPWNTWENSINYPGLMSHNKMPSVYGVCQAFSNCRWYFSPSLKCPDSPLDLSLSASSWPGLYPAPSGVPQHLVSTWCGGYMGAGCMLSSRGKQEWGSGIWGLSQPLCKAEPCRDWELRAQEGGFISLSRLD